MTELEAVRESIKHWEENLRKLVNARKIHRVDIFSSSCANPCICWDGSACPLCVYSNNECAFCPFNIYLGHFCPYLGWHEFNLAMKTHNLKRARYCARAIISNLKKIEHLITNDNNQK